MLAEERNLRRNFIASEFSFARSVWVQLLADSLGDDRVAKLISSRRRKKGRMRQDIVARA